MAQETERIHDWTEMHGNPYLRKIDIGMLLDSGLIIEQKGYLRGQSAQLNEPKYRKFRFDVTFVEAQLSRLILKPLKCETLEQLQARIDRAKANYEAYKCSLLKSEQTEVLNRDI